MLARRFYGDGPVSPITASLAQVPELIEVALPFIGAALGPGALDARSKEIAILRTSALLECAATAYARTPSSHSTCRRARAPRPASRSRDSNEPPGGPRVEVAMGLGQQLFLQLVYLSSSRWMFEQPHEWVPLLILALVPAGRAWGLDGRLLGRRPQLRRWPF